MIKRMKQPHGNIMEVYVTYSPEVIEQARKYAVAMSEARSKQPR